MIFCPKCHWDSLVNTVDIRYKDPESSVLSNLFPHSFLFFSDLWQDRTDKVYCRSMESFLQSLKVKVRSPLNPQHR